MIIGLLISIITVFVVLFSIYQFLFGQKFVHLPRLDGNFIESKIVVDNLKRKFSYFLPNGVSVDTNILIVLHGAQDNGEIFRKRLGYEFDKISEKEKFIVIYPNGYKKSWNDCRLNASYPAKKSHVNDISFLKEIKGVISEKHNITIKNVFIVGYSNGGQLANKICLQFPEFITAACVVAANLPIEKNLDCIEKNIPVPILFLSGTADKTNPFKGGEVKVLNIKKMGFVKSAAETINYWNKLAQCDEYQKICIKKGNQNSDTRIEKKIWRKNKIDFIWQYTVFNGGHTIPHTELSFPRILGYTNHDINFTDEIWKFFKQKL